MNENENKAMDDVAFRIQERILKETRQELGVERAKVKILQERIEKEETTALGYQDLLCVERDGFAQKIAEKNGVIEMLKKRVDSVNNEYNRAWSDRGAQAPAARATVFDPMKFPHKIPE